jgi:hypothetical protein
MNRTGYTMVERYRIYPFGTARRTASDSREKKKKKKQEKKNDKFSTVSPLASRKFFDTTGAETLSENFKGEFTSTTDPSIDASTHQSPQALMYRLHTILNSATTTLEGSKSGI